MHFRGLAVIVVFASLLLVALPVHARPRQESPDVKTRIIKILQTLRGLLPTTLEDGIVPPKP